MHQIPNVLTVFRILLIAPFAYLVLNREYEPAFWVFFIAGVSDGVDGFLARRFQWRSRFGAIADPLADKLLLITTYVTLAWMELLPVWLVVLIFGRDLVIVLGGLLYHYKIQRFDIEPTLLGKLCTFVQISFVVLMLFQLAGYISFSLLDPYGVLLVALVTTLSGLHYVMIWANRTRVALRARGSK